MNFSNLTMRKDERVIDFSIYLGNIVYKLTDLGDILEEKDVASKPFDQCH